MRDSALRLERTYVYRRPIHRLRRLHNRIALSETAEANVLVRGLLSIQEIKLYLLNTKTAKHFVPSSFLAPSARLALSTGCLLAVLLSTFRPTCIVLPAALSERAYRRRHPLSFPGHRVSGHGIICPKGMHYPLRVKKGKDNRTYPLPGPRTAIQDR
jgi:hypothetical protein